MKVCNGGVAALMLASIIFNDKPWGLDRGWEQQRVCRQYMKEKVLCRQLVEQTFRRHFPLLTFQWPDCGKDDLAEAVLWAAVIDRGWVDRYMEQFRRICGAVR